MKCAVLLGKRFPVDLGKWHWEPHFALLAYCFVYPSDNCEVFCDVLIILYCLSMVFIYLFKESISKAITDGQLMESVDFVVVRKA